MLVDTTMAEMSDLTFRTAFIVYIVALIMAFVYYGRVNSVIEARREALAGDMSVRQRLLDYNAGDVHATRIVREWMSAGAPGIPEL